MKLPLEDITALELQKVGFSLREAQVYLIILEHSHCTTKMLMDTMQLTRPTVHRTLKNLIDKEFVHENKTSVRMVSYIAISPDELLSLIRNRKRIVDEQERELLRIMAQLRRRDANTRNTIVTYPHDATGKHALYKRLMQTNAQNVYVFIAHTRHLTQSKLHHAYDSILSRHGTNTHIHEIVLPHTKNLPARHPHVKRTTLTKSSALPTKHTLIVSDHTSIITDDEVIIFDVDYATDLHRALLTHCVLNAQEE